MSRADLDYSVIICAYTEERWDDLMAAVHSVKGQSVPPGEIIVVIDHNQKLLERAQACITDVIVLANRGKPGASEARNTGVAAAKGKVIVFLDDDAEAHPDWLEQLSVGFKDPAVLGVGGAIEPIWLEGRPAWFPEEFNWVIGGTHRVMPAVTTHVRNLWCGNMSIRREVFEALGGFRSGYGNVKVNSPSRPFWIRSCAGDEETEFCIQANRRWPNKVWLYLPQAKVQHRIPATRGKWIYFFKRCYDEGVGKALLSRLVGTKLSLAREQIYTLRILPYGIIQNIGDVIKGDITGLARVGAIVAGFVVTTVGYLVGTIYTTLARDHNVMSKDNIVQSEAIK